MLVRIQSNPLCKALCPEHFDVVSSSKWLFLCSQQVGRLRSTGSSPCWLPGTWPTGESRQTFVEGANSHWVSPLTPLTRGQSRPLSGQASPSCWEDNAERRGWRSDKKVFKQPSKSTNSGGDARACRKNREGAMRVHGWRGTRGAWGGSVESLLCV